MNMLASILGNKGKFNIDTDDNPFGKKGNAGLSNSNMAKKNESKGGFFSDDSEEEAMPKRVTDKKPVGEGWDSSDEESKPKK